MRKHIVLSSCILLLILCLFPVHAVFAADTNTAGIGAIPELLNLFFKFASWGWTIIAVLAGKLMSNDFIYAHSLHLDETLFKLRTFMKNMANLTLGLLLLRLIVSSLFKKDYFNVKKELPPLFLASVLINMSWFLMGALIDLSNVATAAVGSLPQTFIQGNVIANQGFQELNVTIPEKMTFDLNKENGDLCQRTYTSTKDLDRIRARFNDMSGPLLFLGASIYRIQDLCALNPHITQIKDMTTAMIIKLIILIMFLAPLIALFFVNLKRVFYLWLFIIFSPILVLLDVTKKFGKSKAGFMEKFSLSEIPGLVFAPVFTIGGMALVLILSTSMYYVLGGNPGGAQSTTAQTHILGSAEITSSKNQTTFHNGLDGTDITFIGDVFGDMATYAGGLAGYLIITAFTIILLRGVLKISMSSSKMLKGTFDSIMKLGQTAATSMDFVPMGGKTYSLDTLSKGGDIMNRAGNEQLAKRGQGSKETLRTDFYDTKFGKAVSNAFDIPTTELGKRDLKDEELLRLRPALAGAGTLQNYIQALQNNLGTMIGEDRYIGVQSGNFMKLIKETLPVNSEFKNLKNILEDKSSDEEFKKNLFDISTPTGKSFAAYLNTSLKNGYQASWEKGTGVSSDMSDYVIYGQKPTTGK